MFDGVSAGVLALLVVVAFVGGIGITTIGPGGIFVTVALYVLTPLSSAAVAGTAHATFIATGVIGAAAYRRSGELLEGDGRALAAILSVTGILGALAGSRLNALVSRRLFGLLLGATAAVTGLTLAYREWRGLRPAVAVDATTRRGQATVGAVGTAIGVAAGLVGVGGPVLTVPALVVLGVPILVGLAAAQVQSVFISGFATAGYLSHDAVSFPFVLLVGTPQLAGVVAGWAIARRVDPGRLKSVLGIVLVGVGAYLTVA